MPRPPRPPELRIGLGIDLISVARLSRLLGDHPQASEELFTATELASPRSGRRRVEHLAGRFAAKEAVLKACGTGLGRRMRWTDVEVVNEALGRPRVRLHGELARWAEEHAVRQLEVSLTHSSGLALAQALVVWGPVAGGR